MKPPIPSPNGDPKKQVVFTGRLQWDDELGCLVLDYSTPFAAHFRFLFQSIRFQPARIVQLPVLPITFVLLLLVHYARFSPRVISTQIHGWGIRDVTPELTTQKTWLQIKQIVECNDDIFLLGGMGEAMYIPREVFENAAEKSRLFEIILQLKQSAGADWATVIAPFHQQKNI